MEVKDDGELSITISGGPADGQTVKLDLWQAKLAFEQVEAKHGVGEKFKATPDFLSDLCGVAGSLGVSPCTPTLAYKLWHAVGQAWMDVKKNTETLPNSRGPTKSTRSRSAKKS